MPKSKIVTRGGGGLRLLAAASIPPARSLQLCCRCDHEDPDDDGCGDQDDEDDNVCSHHQDDQDDNGCGDHHDKLGGCGDTVKEARQGLW